MKNKQLREELNEMKAQMALILEKMPYQQSNASASAGLAVELVNRENEKILNMMNISLNDPFIKSCAFSSVFETIGRPMVFIASLSKNKTQIVLDTGAGANCINPKFLEDKNVQLLSEYLFPKSLKIQVGNSQTTNITKAVLVEMKTTNNKALFWFLVVEHLPMNALIGHPSAVKEFIHYDQEGQIWWHNELLQSEKLKDSDISIYSILNKKLEEKDERTNPPQPTITVKWQKIKPYTLQSVQVKLVNEENQFTDEAFFMPNKEIVANLVILPGLINFDEQTKEATILVQNLTGRPKSIPDKICLGTSYFITEQDAEETELFEMGDKSITQTMQMFKEKQKQTPQEKKTVKRKLKHRLKVKNVQISVSKVYLDKLVEIGCSNLIMFGMLIKNPMKLFIQIQFNAQLKQLATQ